MGFSDCMFEVSRLGDQRVTEGGQARHQALTIARIALEFKSYIEKLLRDASVKDNN